MFNYVWIHIRRLQKEKKNAENLKDTSEKAY